MQVLMSRYLIVRARDEASVFSSLSPIFLPQSLSSFKLDRHAVSMHRQFHLTRFRTPLKRMTHISVSSAFCLAPSKRQLGAAQGELLTTG